MLIGKSAEKIIQLDYTKAQYHFRFTNSINQQVISFEETNIRQRPNQQLVIRDEDDEERELTWPSLSYWQSYRYYQEQSGPYYIYQVTSLKNQKHYQFIINQEKSKFSFFGQGVIEKWVLNLHYDSQEDLIVCMTELIHLLKNQTQLMSLRVKPYMPGLKSLNLIEQFLSPIGFFNVSARSYEKTRLMDLRPETSLILNSFSANGRARLKIKTKDCELVEVKEINSHQAIPHLQKALDESYFRSVQKGCTFNFTPLIRSARSLTQDVLFLGFYFKESPLTPKAFVSGIIHGPLVEFSVGGSLSDEALRSFPFNHILLWKLAMITQSRGVEFFDLGGITSADSTDPLRGISTFKRFFPGFELTTGKEMEINLQPHLKILYTFLFSIRKSLNIFKGSSK